MVLSLLVRSVLFVLLFVATTAGDSPVAKVIKLLEDLKKEVVDEGKKEAEAYEKFACFCKESSKDKSGSIVSEEDKIETLSAEIGDDSGTKEEKERSVTDRKNAHTELGAALSASVSRCAAAQAKYEAEAADMTKAIESLNKAIKSMGGKKDKIKAASLIASNKDVQHAMALAKMDLVLDPSDPAYKYHSKEINELLANLLKDFEDKKKDGEDKWEKTSTACTEEKDGLNTKMKDNMAASDAAEEKIADLEKEVAKDRGDLVETEDDLKEDEVYLKDVTSQCEDRARDWDQRSKMRNDEIEALTSALTIIGGKVESADKVNERAFVQKAWKQSAVRVPLSKPLSFLQAAPVKAVTNFLAREVVSTNEQVMQERVVSLLRQEGSRLSSPELAAVSMRITADHFKKVKEIIQDLIVKLMEEANAEASKKGFCDSEIGKANINRDNARKHADSMSVELKMLEARKEELESELTQLGKDIEDANKELRTASDLRSKEKDENAETLKTAREGADALKEAILILKAFYSQAGRASFLQRSAEDPGFEGSYKGKQEGSKAIFGLLETIAADFERTISKTELAEKEAAAAFVKFDRTSKENIGSKETKTKLNKQDLKSTSTQITKTLDDLQTEMGLLDDSLKMIESLKPACLDAGGLNYKERTAKREEEVAALKKAICILTPGKKEGECDK